MSRMRIEYTDLHGDEAGGYLDAVSHWFQYNKYTTMVVFGQSANCFIHAPVAEVVKMLDAARAEQRAAEAYGKDPEPLDLKKLSGNQPKPRKGLASHFGH